MSETLVFTIPDKGTITITNVWDQWYLVEGKQRTFLNDQWFYERLHNNYEGICMAASVLDSQCDFEEGQQRIKDYEDKYDECVGNCGQDVVIMFFEMFLQKATGTPNLHWW